MSIDESDDDFNRALEENLNRLFTLGYVEIVGINESGEWLYKATEEGQKFALENRTFSKDEGIDGLN